MDIKDNIDFYLKTIPALSSPGWEYTDSPEFHDVLAWHRLNISDPDIGIRGRICLQNRETRTHYFIRLDNGEGDDPAFMEIAQIRLGVFEPSTKSFVQPTFPELEAESLRVAYQMIAEKRAGWIERRKEYLKEINTLFNFGLKGC